MFVLDQVRPPGYFIPLHTALNSFPDLRYFVPRSNCLSFYSDCVNFIFILSDSYFYKFYKPECFELALNSFNLESYINFSCGDVSQFHSLKLITLSIYPLVRNTPSFDQLLISYNDASKKLKNFSRRNNNFVKIVRNNEKHLFETVFSLYYEDITHLLGFSDIDKMINDWILNCEIYAHNDFHINNLFCTSNLIISDFEMSFLHRSTMLFDFVNFSRFADKNFRFKLLSYFDISLAHYVYIQQLLSFKNLFILEYLEKQRGWDVCVERSKFLEYFH